MLNQLFNLNLQKGMRSRNFEVPVDLMQDFAEFMEKYELDNVIEGVTEEGDIAVTVEYELGQKKIINQIHDMIDEYNEQYEEENEEEEEQEEEED